MTFYLALSCLQGRPAFAAAKELLSISPGNLGLQLTPGCGPSEGDIFGLGCPLRTHAGYIPDALRARVWTKKGEIMWKGDSIHPPLEKDLEEPSKWNEQVLAQNVVETMYPGYAWLNNGDSIERAMASGFRLAVDISHLAILERREMLSKRQCKKIFDYDRIDEIHVSRNTGFKDSHMPLSLDGSDFGFEWAKQRLAAGTVVVYEAYLHRIEPDYRKRQVDLMLG